MPGDQSITEPSDESRPLPFLPTHPLKDLGLLITVILHWIVVIGNLSAFIILSIQGLVPGYGVDWYVALPLCSFIGLVTFSRVLDCPMTQYENALRARAGRPLIKGFIKHYFLKPYIRWKIKRRSKSK